MEQQTYGVGGVGANYEQYTKYFLKSRTIIFNAAVFIVAVGTYFGLSSEPATQDQIKNALEIIVPVVNIVLRFATSKSVYVK